jgi:hypothetical protein
LNPVALDCIDEEIRSGRHSRFAGLLQASAVALTGNEFLKNGKNLFTVAVNPLQVVSKAGLKAWSSQPFVQERLWDINVAAQRLHRVTSQEEAVKHCRFTLGSKRVEVVSQLSVLHREPPQKQKYKHVTRDWQAEL